MRSVDGVEDPFANYINPQWDASAQVDQEKLTLIAKGCFVHFKD